MEMSASGKRAARSVPSEPREQEQSIIYQWIMTPINLITFLLSLYLVEYYYQTQRWLSRSAPRGRLQGWLEFIYRPQPYSWVGGGAAPPNKNDERWYYHTKQKRLMRMEASDAFGLRKPVLIGLLAIGVGIIWSVWRLLLTAYHFLS